MARGCGTGSTSVGGWRGPASPLRGGGEGPGRAGGPGTGGVTLWQRVVQANRPGPPEDSVPVPGRLCRDRLRRGRGMLEPGELRAGVSPFTMVATVVGNVVSSSDGPARGRRSSRCSAVCAVGGFVWFIVTVTHDATPGDISTVE